MRGEWLTKSEVNRLYYDTVGGDIVFETEASAGRHPSGVARLISARARALGKRHVHVLEIGANDAGFARAVLLELRTMREAHETQLERLDYVAVELARGSLERAAAREEELGEGRRVLGPAGAAPVRATTLEPPPKPTLVALVAVESSLSVNLGLVHADANQFVRENSARFDIAILNELLDDLPYRAYFADASGRRFEAVPLSRGNGGRWTIRIEAHELPAGGIADLPPLTMTATSEEAVELVRGIATALEPGGMLLLHDYGFAEPYVPLALYERPPPSVPAFAKMLYPSGSGAGFPLSFFRVFGNDEKRVVQVTNDVNFAELAEALAPSGAVTVIPHGNQILHSGGSLKPGQGTFLSEFASLEAGADAEAVLERLEREQMSVRDAYVREYMAGRPSIFTDLVYLKRR
jgi:hypothetical protein